MGQQAAPEGAHGHAEARDDLVDEVRVHARIQQDAGGLRVGRKHAVHAEAGAVAHHHARLLDALPVLHDIQHHLQGQAAIL